MGGVRSKANLALKEIFKLGECVVQVVGQVMQLGDVTAGLYWNAVI